MHQPFISLLGLTIIFCFLWSRGYFRPSGAPHRPHPVMAGFPARLPGWRPAPSRQQPGTDGAFTLWKLFRALFIALLNVQT